MQKQGSVTIYGIMISVAIIVLVLALSGPIKDFTDTARNETSGDTIGMNCSTTEDIFVKAGCLASDITIFYWIGGVLFLIGTIISARIIFG